MGEIDLTEEQMKALKPLQREIERAFAEGDQPALLAQVFPLQAVAEVRFIDGNTGEELKKVLRNNGYVRKLL